MKQTNVFACQRIFLGFSANKLLVCADEEHQSRRKRQMKSRLSIAGTHARHFASIDGGATAEVTSASVHRLHRTLDLPRSVPSHE